MFDGTDNDDRKPCAEEIYELATNASNLRQEADRRGAADVLRDMAMSTDRLGAALRRLRGQWEAVEKPTRQRTRSIKEWLAVLTEPTYDVRDERGQLHTITRAEAAERSYQQERATHDSWHQRELARLMTHLADLPAVRDAITIQAVKWGMAEAADKAGAVIRYWLDQNCNRCDGRKFQTIEGSPGLSTKVCKGCHGSGVAPVPHGQDGRKLANHMDQCLHRHKQTLKARRKALGSIPPIDRLSKRAQPGGPDPEVD